jgi:flagellar biosynthesis protein FlhF
MAIQLEKQASARESASVNERATTRSGAFASAPAPTGAPTSAPTSASPNAGPVASPSGAPSTRVPSHPLPTTETVAQRFVLVAQPAAPGAKSGLVAQLATALPKPASQPVVAAAAPAPVASQSAKPVAAAPIAPARTVESPASRDAQVGMAAFVPMEFMHPEPLPEKSASKAVDAAVPAIGAGSAAFVSPISIDPWNDHASTRTVAVDDSSVDAPANARVEEIPEPVSRVDVGAGAAIGIEIDSAIGAEIDIEIDVDPAIEIDVEQPASSAISIAAPLSSAEPASRAQPRGDDELSAISEFVGRVLDGRGLDSGVSDNRVPDGRMSAGSTAPRTLPTVEPVVLRTEPLPRVERVVAEPARTSFESSVVQGAARAEVLERAYARLIEQEVAADLAERIVDSVASEMQAALDAGAEPSERVVRASIERRIAALLPADAEDGLGGSSSRMLPGKFGARRIAFIGPTGVGKTTTLAKVAAQLKLKRGLSVGIVAADTYRIAAVDQLRTYAEILEVPVEVAASPSDAERACQRLADEHDVDVILIDTAGRSQNDRMKLSELRAFLGAAQPDETHLVLSATASARTLEREAAAFGAVGIDRIVLTKLDEAATFGTLISLVERLGKRVSFLTHGQEVPDHIEPGRGRRLAELVMGSEVR